MLVTLFCLASMAQAQCPDGDCAWQATTTPSGVKAGWVQESYGKRFLKEVAECPAYLKPRPPDNLPSGQWRLVLDTENKANWRRWQAGIEDVVYPKSLSGTIFPSQDALALYVRSSPDLKPPVEPTDPLLGMMRGVDVPELKKAQAGGHLFASKAGLEPDEPPVMAGQVPIEVAAGVFGVIAFLALIGTVLYLAKGK